jgi:iron complex transport system ATP-binding protein
MTRLAPHALRAESLTLGYDGRTVIEKLDLEVPDGRITSIVGPNASGKSTLLRGLARLMRPESGRVTLDGRDIRSYGPKEFARRVAVLPQQPVAPDGVLVAELVARGRHPHRGWFGGRSSGDERVVAEVLEATGTAELADRSVSELSGGQRQRVWIAMALAQRADIVLLDEPTSFLDVSHQLELLDLLTESNREHGTTVVMVLHELNLAARYADHLVVVDGGRIAAAGDPADVMTAETVGAAFGLECVVAEDPVAGSPMIVPIGRFHRSSQLG